MWSGDMIFDRLVHGTVLADYPISIIGAKTAPNNRTLTTPIVSISEIVHLMELLQQEEFCE